MLTVEQGFEDLDGSQVPSLSFMGLRPSLQGCSGLGAPPPEEPGVEQPAVQPVQIRMPEAPEAGGICIYLLFTTHMYILYRVYIYVYVLSNIDG